MPDFRRKQAPYIFLGHTQSLCGTCLEVIPAKIISEGGEVFLQKRCAAHGVQKVKISSDVKYYHLCQDFLKPGDWPLQFQTRIKHGCPHDCGLCPDHEQHSCLALIEVNDECNLSCPTCFAASRPGAGRFRTLEEIRLMLDALIASEKEPDLLQISGGEPTLHPDILQILRMALDSPVRHVMLNTNGLRIARDADFVRRLAELMPGFEVYLQFDSLRAEGHRTLRGANLVRIKQEALENLERFGISTTLVATVRRGVNDEEIDEIINHALGWNCVRGVTFQPVQDCGRNDGFEPGSDRFVLSDIRRVIVEGSNPFGEKDMIPLPCNPESICIGYGLRKGREVLPVTSLIPHEAIVAAAPNAITFEKYPEFQQRMLAFFSLANTPDCAAENLSAMLCCLPKVQAPEGFGYENIFRVAIVEFLDRHNFCLGRVKRSCIHFVAPDGRIIPFDTYNLFYRQQFQGQAEQAGHGCSDHFS